MKNLNTLLFVSFGILLLAASSYAHDDHVCVHDKLKVESDTGMHHEDPTGRKRVLADWAPFRVATDFSNLDTLPAANADFGTYIKNNIVPAAIRWINATYQVKQYTSPLQAPQGKISCGDNTTGTYVTLPASITGNNSLPNTDLMVVVGWAYDPNSAWVARAYTCTSDAATGRTYIGAIQFNLKFASSITTNWDGRLGVTLHELHHILFMSPVLFPKYYDPTTSNQKAVNAYTYKVIDNLNVTVITHPQVVAEAQSYFGCKDLDYVSLENQGDSGNAGTHWERKWFGNEFLTASTSSRMPVSRISLALAEASGWYKANFDMVETLVWGKNRGCDFVKKPCLSGTPLVASAPEFCSKLNVGGCDYEWNSGSACSWSQSNTSVPPAFNYFNDNSSVSDLFVDNCPTMVQASNRHCVSTTAAPLPRVPEYLGQGSACFVSTLSQKSLNLAPALFGQCFQYQCTPQAGGNFALNVTIGNVNVTCASENQAITLSKDYYGMLTCPDPNTFCQLKVGYCPRGCGGAGTCDNGVCTCNAGRIGPDCLRDDPTVTQKIASYLRRV